MGVARKIREYNSKVQIIGVQPGNPNHRQQGLIKSEEYCPEILNADKLDKIITVEKKTLSTTPAIC